MDAWRLPDAIAYSCGAAAALSARCYYADRVEERGYCHVALTYGLN